MQAVIHVHPNQVLAHPARVAGTFVAATTLNTTVLLENVATHMMNLSFGIAMLVWNASLDGTLATLLFQMIASGQPPATGEVPLELAVTHVILQDQRLMIQLLAFQAMSKVRNLVQMQKGNFNLLRSLDRPQCRKAAQPPVLVQLPAIHVDLTQCPELALPLRRHPPPLQTQQTGEILMWHVLSECCDSVLMLSSDLLSVSCISDGGMPAQQQCTGC